MSRLPKVSREQARLAVFREALWHGENAARDEARSYVNHGKALLDQDEWDFAQQLCMVLLGTGDAIFVAETKAAARSPEETEIVNLLLAEHLL